MDRSELRRRVAVVKAVSAPVAPDRVRALVVAAASLPELAARLPRPDWELAVRISGDRELRRLNRRYLDEDHATDVLSFPADDPHESHLGDIVVSWPAVRRQSAEFGHAEDSELSLLVVHGFLHILGWDHATVSEEQEMNRLTLAALERARIRPARGRLLESSPPG
jgi:probable rRNA maturation factor